MFLHWIRTSANYTHLFCHSFFVIGPYIPPTHYFSFSLPLSFHALSSGRCTVWRTDLEGRVPPFSPPPPPDPLLSTPPLRGFLVRQCLSLSISLSLHSSHSCVLYTVSLSFETKQTLYMYIIETNNKPQVFLWELILHLSAQDCFGH